MKDARDLHYSVVQIDRETGREKIQFENASIETAKNGKRIRDCVLEGWGFSDRYYTVIKDTNTGEIIEA